MRSPRAGVSTGRSNVPAPARAFRSEMERQLLAIQEAFSTAVNDNERRKRDLEDRLRELEREGELREDRLRSVERQKQDLEDQLRETARQLRKLQKTLPMRIIRLLKRLIP
jgi:septal ring factor EnvC (AmiA/AmiB activator)